MREILAVDPGSSQSAYVHLLDHSPVAHDILANVEIERMLYRQIDKTVVIEMVACYGMPVGAEIFETCVWIGRFMAAASQCTVHRVYRAEVKNHLCKSPRANDATIRQALIDRYGPGKEKAIGTKRNPGPLYGFFADQWAALAVGLTWLDTKGAAHA